MHSIDNHEIKPVPWILAGMLVLLSLTACATSKMEANWHDSSYSGSGILEDTLVIAMVDDQTIRRLYEDTFVAKLAAEGVHATQSYKLSLPDIKPNKDGIRAAVKEAGASSVLITRHLGTDTKEHRRPSTRSTFYADHYYSSMSSYYPMVYQEMGYTVQVTTVSLEANLYDAKTEKLVWSVRSESTNPPAIKKYIPELVDMFSSDLKKSGLL